MAKKKLYTATYTFDGKRYYVRSSSSQREADKKAAKALAAREEGIPKLDENTTVTEYATRWVETYKRTTVSKPVYSEYVHRINDIIIPAIGPLKMKNIKPTHLQEIMNAHADKSKSYCSKLLVIIHGIFRQAVKDEIIRRDPSEAVKEPKTKSGTHRSITPEERHKILETAKTHPFGLAVKILLMCGLRPQEVVALKWSDIDQINRRIMVRRAQKKSGDIAETKTEAGARNVPIPPALWDSLSIPDDIDKRIIVPPRGEGYTYSGMLYAWHKFKAAADVNIDMYDLRHTYCTDLEAAGVPINVAKYLMGHSNILMTSKIYTHMRDDTLASAADKIAKIGATTGATIKGKFAVKNGKFILIRDRNFETKTGTK